MSVQQSEPIPVAEPRRGRAFAWATAIVLICEWLVFVSVAGVATLIAFTVVDDPEIDNEAMHLVDWIDVGMFGIVAVLLTTLPLIVAALLFNLFGGVGTRRGRRLVLVMAGANALAAAWYLASMSEFGLTSGDYFIALLLLIVSAMVLMAGGVIARRERVQDLI